MQIIIPMSGFGERFKRAGYTVPKPLIPVDGKPIIAHVLDMFPGETEFVFICNEDHLATPEFRMSEILRSICPTGTIVSIPAHKLGPVNAVLAASDVIAHDQPTIVNYCDFTCYWDYEDFKKFVTETYSDGCIPAYRGFHPHSLGSTFYAYMKQTELWMDDIQEKQPWTDNPTSEFASSGTYYFKTGALCLDMFEQQVRQNLSVNNEFYASLAYKVMQQSGLKTSVYELQHFMQWGTPADLEEYKNWSNIFRRLAVDEAKRAHQRGTVLVPMAGLGKRFTDQGYSLVKPLIPTSGRAMVLQATRDLPQAPRVKFVVREDMAGVNDIIQKLKTSFVGAEIQSITGLTEGQAVTCQLGLEGIDRDQPLTIGACDNGMLYDVAKLETLLAEDGPDVIVWVIRGHFDGKARPTMFGWVDTDENGLVTDVIVKQAPDDPSTAAMIVGAFTFRKCGDFDQAVEALIAREGRVNGEFYVDSLLKDALDAGLNCRVFEIDHYVGWGTPNDLQTFEYWQSCFDKWDSHPYSLSSDRRIPKASLPKLRERFATLIPQRPPGLKQAQMTAASTESKTNRFTYLPLVALFTALIACDYLIYLALIETNWSVPTAKSVSFLLTAVLAIVAKRFIRPRRRSSSETAMALPIMLVAIVIPNVISNDALLAVLQTEPYSQFLAYAGATGLSAGMMAIAYFLTRPFRG